MTLILTPTTAVPGASITATGKASRKRATRIRIDGTLVLGFTTGGSGEYARAVIVPTRPNGTYSVVVQQRGTDGVWRQVDHADLAIKAVVVPPPDPDPPPPPPPPTDPGPVVLSLAVDEITQTSAKVTWSLSEKATGQVEFGETPAYGQATPPENSLSWQTHVQRPTGLKPGAVCYFKVVGKDSAGQSYVRAGTFTTFGTTPEPPPPPPPPVTTIGRIYGPGIGGDGLGNSRLGNTAASGTLTQSVRFRAEQASPLVTVTQYHLGRVDPGYAGGNSGTALLELKADDPVTHIPVGAALASQVLPPLPIHDPDYVATFTNPYTTVKDRLYHIVWTNTDPNENVNFRSLDHWFYRQVPTGAPNGQRNPRFPNLDWEHLLGDTSGGWEVRPNFTPILDIGYANGKHQGQSYGEAVYGPDDVGQISGPLKVRERFTFGAGSFTFRQFGIRLLREYGNDPLNVRVQTAAGVLVDVLDIPASAFATGPAFTGGYNGDDNNLGVNAKWVNRAFGQDRTLVNGTNDLLLSTMPGTKYWAWLNRQLSESYTNYTPATAFHDGQAECSSDGGATWRVLGVDPRQYDLQFWLGTV